jgi:hypothetical protein
VKEEQEYKEMFEKLQSKKDWDVNQIGEEKLERQRIQKEKKERDNLENESKIKRETLVQQEMPLDED